MGSERDLRDSPLPSGSEFVLTLKPDKQLISELLDKGFTSFRVNFGRRNLSQNIEALKLCRRGASARGLSCNIMADLPGQKFRVGRFERGEEYYREGDLVSFEREALRLSRHSSVTGVTEELFGHVKRGDSLIAGGKVRFSVLRIKESSIECEVLTEGRLYNRCGIEIENRYVIRDRLTKKDLDVVSATYRLVDFFCPSFVDTPEIITDLRKRLVRGHCVDLIAKIESPLGVQNMAEIGNVADGLMLARGDLGIFYSLDEMRQIGERLSRIAFDRSKYVFFATDFFASLASGASELTPVEKEQLEWALALELNGIVVNETASSPHWLEIVREMVKWTTLRG